MSDRNKKEETTAVEQTDRSKTKKDKAPAKKDQKPGLLTRIGRWFREMKSELKKVSWPSAQSTLKNVGTVLLCVIVVGVFIWVFDWIIHAVIQALLNLF